VADTSNQARSGKRVGLAVTLISLCLAAAHVLWPTLRIDAVTLGLLIVAVLPWLAPIFKSLEFPGGWKIQFQDLQRVADRAEQAGILLPVMEKPRFAFQSAADADPNLALAGLRIEIEKRLVAIAEASGIEVRNRGIGQLLRALTERQILDPSAAAALRDMSALLNSAVHGATVEPFAVEWAMETGPRVLAGLDEIARRAAFARR
jgi:hypothetical protein